MQTILVVDAEAGSSNSVEAILQRRGFRGIVATNAREALALLRQHRSIDLIISEMQLPDMDGLHFLTAVRAVAPGLPIIIVTNSGSIESYLHAVNLGVYEYLNKPVLPKELVRIASIALTARRPIAPMRDAS